MKRLNRYIIIFSGAFLLLFPKKISRACGFYVSPGEYRFWLLQPDLANIPDLSPFFFATTYLYRNNLLQVQDGSDTVNINEWYELTKHAASKKDISDILYNTNPDIFLGNSDSLTKANSFARYLWQPANKEVLDYMHLAKRVEAIAARPDPWEESTPNNPRIVNEIDFADSFYSQSRIPYIRLRTAYQLMRLYRYNRKDSKAAALYDERIAPVQTDSWIKTAALYEKAGCVSFPESDYLYSKVFDKGNYRRTYCLIHFRSNDLQKILPLAKSDHERTVLYTMKALNYPGKALSMLRNIYLKEPSCKEIPFLLLREINKVEDWLVTNKVTDFLPATNYHWKENLSDLSNYSLDRAYARKLYQFITELIRDKKQSFPALLHLYASHLAMVQEDYATSQQQLTAAKKYGLPNYQMQIQINQLLLNVIAHKTLSVKDEQQLMTILLTPGKQLEVHSPGLMKDQLMLFIGKKLIAHGDRVKGLLLLSKTHRALGELPIDDYKRLYQLMAEVATPEDYDNMVKVLDRKNKTTFEKFFTSGFFGSPWNYYDYMDEDSLLWDRNKLLEGKATWYIQHDSLEAALHTMKQLPDTFYQQEPYSTYINGDPFYLNINHAYRTEPHESYCNKKEVVREMIRLKKLLQTDSSNNALYYYKLANAYYNMSYYGKNWLMVKQWWSTEEVSSYNDDLKRTSFNDVYYGCKRARDYYLKALKATADKKLASLCCFMAGECDKNFKTYINNIAPKKNTRRSTNPYLPVLKQKGFDADYYRELVTECATYASYVQQLRN